MKKFFNALKTIYGSQSSGTTPLLSADGTNLLTDREAILKRSAEQFDSVLNRPSSINDDAINRLPQVEYKLLLDEFPTVAETVKAIKLLSSGKAPGSDAIPAEIYKAGGTPVAKKMTELLHIMWRKEAIPQEFKVASIIHLFKRKGEKGKRKVQGVPQSQTAALPRPQEEEETDKSKQAQTEQTYEKH